MKTVGTDLKSAREQNNISLRDLSRETRIKTELLEALESESWEKLPELPVLVGFVRSMSDAIGLHREQAVALLRRDYPPKKISVNPTPDVKREFRLGQRTLYALVAIVGMCIVGIYLFFQYKAFTSPPNLLLLSPTENEVVTTKTITVRGTTDSTASITINGQTTLVDDNGNFATDIAVVKETKQIEVHAVSRTGRETTVSRTIVVQQK